jgi:hypothetical protein
MFRFESKAKHFCFALYTNCFNFVALFIKTHFHFMATMSETEKTRKDWEKQLAAKQASRLKSETTHSASVSKSEAAHQATRGKAEDKFKASLTKIDAEIAELQNLLASLPRV